MLLFTPEKTTKHSKRRKCKEQNQTARQGQVPLQEPDRSLWVWTTSPRNGIFALHRTEIGGSRQLTGLAVFPSSPLCLWPQRCECGGHMERGHSRSSAAHRAPL
ncbi:hypothetical protein AAFF_G00124080 [Aldrovandia affinis]|uniref:Uncharacterized protein n=1 Tax=Aldrovandia affinis TaxID=143900 RepID=A0AAD7RRE8_9TELE|nr:hypothetical protein AAFF_G00124080 [Aldrovandia affinis]